MKKNCFFACAAALLFSLPSLAAEPARLLEEIQRLEGEYGGHLGFMARNLKTGETVGLNADERFPTASVIKLPVMAAVFDLVDASRLDLSDRVELARQDIKPGSGILQQLSPGTTITLLDAVKLMIVLSDNTATNLVLDRIAPSHAERMEVVNRFLTAKGLKNTRILNRLYSRETKQSTPEAIRYGIGVATPEDMVLLLEGLYRKTLVRPESCEKMLEILKQQFYQDMIPRLLPVAECKYLQVANKTGFVNESKVDTGLILSDKADIALAIFVDKHPDHRGDIGNRGFLLAAHAARAVWNHFTGSRGYDLPRKLAYDVDWNTYPGGKWAIYRSNAAPFPHKARAKGYRRARDDYYPPHPHYTDSSVAVVVPEGFRETAVGSNVIVHFHGHMNDNMAALERYRMPQGLTAQRINALLVMPQGPYRARDSFGGKMEDPGGFQRLVEDVLATMKAEGITQSARLGRLIVSAHSGGYEPAALALARGGLTGRVEAVFLFDALYGMQPHFLRWLNAGKGELLAAYTEHLNREHEAFLGTVGAAEKGRVHFTKTAVDHEEVVQAFWGTWLSGLGPDWRSDAAPERR